MGRPEDIGKLERTHEIIEMRKSGMSFSQIGRVQGVSKQRIHKIVKDYLSEMASQCDHTIEEMRQQQEERLDAIRQSLWESRFDPKVAMALLKLEERLAKLRGLDAPQKVAVTDSEGNDVEVTEIQTAIYGRLLG